MCYELHYRGFAGVDPTWEWNPGTAAPARRTGTRFPGGRAPRRRAHRIRPDRGGRNGRPLGRIRRRNRSVVLPARHRNLAADARILRAPVAVPPQGGRSARLGDPAADRSAPRRPSSRSNSTSTAPGRVRGCTSSCSPTCWPPPVWMRRISAYLDAVPAESLAVVNLMSLFGLHRAVAWRRRSGISRRRRSPRRRARAGWLRRCSGWTRRRTASRSTPSMSRPTRCTSRWCASTWSVISSPGNRSWTATSCSGSARTPRSKIGLADSHHGVVEARVRRRYDDRWASASCASRSRQRRWLVSHNG